MKEQEELGNLVVGLILLGLWSSAYFAFRHLYRTKRLRLPLHHEITSVGILALATIGFFWRVLFEENVWVPAGGGDLASFLYPNYVFAAKTLKEGILPLWNPYLYGGAPFAADIQAGIFYPINLIALLTLPEITYQTMEFLAVFHFYLAGVSMYFCLRYLRTGEQQIQRWAALVAGVAYMFSDVFIVHLGNLNMIAVAAWLPLVFLLFHRGLMERSPAKAAAAGVTLGIALFAGHVQPFLYTLLLLGIYFLLEAALEWRAGGGIMVLLRQTGVFAVFVLVAAGVSAMQLLPSFELSNLSLRSEIDYAASAQYSLSPAQLISLFVPNFFGRGPGNYWGPWLRTEMGYVGVLTLVAALVAVVLRRNRMTLFLCLLAAISLSLSFGGYSVTQGWLYSFGAGFDKLRAPARFLFLFDFALAALAGLGIDALLSSLKQNEERWLRGTARFLTFSTVAVALGMLPPFLFLLLLSSNTPSPTMMRLVWISEGTALFVLFLAGSVTLLWTRLHEWAKPGLIGGLALALILFDLTTTGFNVEVGKSDPTVNFQHQGVIDFLKQDESFYRIDSVTDVWDVWQPNTSELNDVFDIMGVYNPMILADLERYWAQLGSRSSPLYDLMNAKYLIGHKNVPLDWTKFELVYDGDPKVNVFRNNKALPRAFVVYSANVATTKEDAFAAVHSEDFDPARQVIVEGGQALSSSLPGSAVTFDDYSANELRLRATTTAPGYLVLSETFYDGWQAWVDGRPEKVLRANFLFRAVSLPEGEHSIRLVFDPPSFRQGLAISGLTWGILGAWMARGIVRRRSQQTERSIG